jgi:two-component system OmpR family sensor kinase
MTVDQPLDPHAEPYPYVPGGWELPPEESLPGAAPEPARRQRWHFAPRSLTGRLVGGVVLLVVFIVFMTALATYFALKAFLYERIDDQLQPVAHSNVASFASCISGNRCVFATSGPGGLHSAQSQWFEVTDLSGNRLLPTSDDPLGYFRIIRLNADQSASLSASPGLHTVQTTDGYTLRVSVTLVKTSEGTFSVITGLSTGDVQRTLHNMLDALMAIGASAVLLAFVATSYGVRLSLRRLYMVTGTAREVAAELSPEGAGLDRRVPVDEPETEVGQLAVSVNTLLSAVETQFAARVASEDRMRQFLADASHELRTPLTSIKGYAELARMQENSGEPADYAGSLQRIENEGNRMSRLVEDLLTLARADQAKIEEAAAGWTVVDLTDLAWDAVEGARAVYPDRQISVSGPVGSLTYGDHDALLRIIRNLVTNAAVHTRAGGPIQVSVSREGPDEVIRVADAGPGLPPEEAAHVFERFWRADKSRARARGGSGLGLSIVASIVQAHGGSVRFDSSVETGSTVTVRLPAASQ